MMFKLSSSSLSSIRKFGFPSYQSLEFDLTNPHTSTYLEFISLMISLILINLFIFWISIRWLFSNHPSKTKRNSKLKFIKSQNKSSTTTCTITTNHHQKKHLIHRIKTIITLFISKHSNQIKSIISIHSIQIKSIISRYSNQIKTWIKFKLEDEYESKSKSKSELIIQKSTPTPYLNHQHSRKRKQKQKLNPNSTLNFTKHLTNERPKPILMTIGTQTDDQPDLSSPRSRTISLQTISEFHQDSNQEHLNSLSNRRSKPNLTLDILDSRSDSHLHQSFQSDSFQPRLSSNQSRVSSIQTQSSNHFHNPTSLHSPSSPPSPLLNQSTLLNHQLELTKSLCWTSPESSSICQRSHTSSASTRTFSTSTTSSHLDLCQCQLHPSDSKSIQLASHSKSQSKPKLHSTDQTTINPFQFESPSRIHLKRLSLGLEINRNSKDELNPTITSWNKLCQPSVSSSDSSRSTHSTNTHPSVINTNEDSFEQDLPPTFSPTLPVHTFHESAPIDDTRFGPISRDLQSTIQDKWSSNSTDPIERSSVITDDQDLSNLFVTHPQLTHSPVALSSVLPLSPSSSLPLTGSQLSEPISYSIQESTIDPSEQQAPVDTYSYLFQSSLHCPTHGFHHSHHYPATRSVSNSNRSHSHNSLPLPSLIPPTPPSSCTPPHLSHLVSPSHPGLSLSPSPLPTLQSSHLYQHPLPSRSTFRGPPPFYYIPNGVHPSLMVSTSSSAYGSGGNGYPSNFLPSAYHPYPNGSNRNRSTSHGSPNPTFYGGSYYTTTHSTSHKKQNQSKRRTSGTQSNSSSNKPPRMENGGENEKDRFKNRLKGMRTKLKELELENSRKERELEIARWRLECVGVEKSLEEIETQKAIHHFLERAERAESYLKVLELKLNHPTVLTPSLNLSHLVLPDKAEVENGFLTDELELGLKMEMEMDGSGIGMKSIEKNIMMNENEEAANEKEVNRKEVNQNDQDLHQNDQESNSNRNQNQKKWQIVKEFDENLLEIEVDE